MQPRACRPSLLLLVALALLLLCAQAAARSLASISITVKSRSHTEDQEPREVAAEAAAANACSTQACVVRPDDANVCGSDGKVYYNECLFQNARCKNAALAKVSAWNGYACPTTCTQHIVCKEIGKFLCGSDGNVYFGYCRLYSAQCVDPGMQEVECPPGLVQIPPRRQH